MAQFRKRPVLVEAEQFTGGPCRGAVKVWVSTINGGVVGPVVPGLGVRTPTREVWAVLTVHEQWCILEPGDWILPEPKPDRFYPVKPDIFEATYERVVRADPGEAGVAMARLAHGIDACIVRPVGPICGLVA